MSNLTIEDIRKLLKEENADIKNELKVIKDNQEEQLRLLKELKEASKNDELESTMIKSIKFQIMSNAMKGFK